MNNNIKNIKHNKDIIKLPILFFCPFLLKTNSKHFNILKLELFNVS